MIFDINVMLTFTCLFWIITGAMMATLYGLWLVIRALRWRLRG